MSDADDLYEELFGERPAKDGVAYERLTAIVFAIRGWNDVIHDVLKARPGAKTEHQIDVTARAPDGTERHVIIECKDWDKTVGKGVLDALVGVSAQLVADAAVVVTTVGYTRGARNVAADEGIGLVRITKYDPQIHGPYVKRAEAHFNFHHSHWSEVAIEELTGAGSFAGTLEDVVVTAYSRLEHLDGTPAELLGEVFELNAAPAEEGAHRCRADFADGRRLPLGDGRSVVLKGLTWTETVSIATETVVVEGVGEALLLVQEIGSDGKAQDGRVVVDRDLVAWQIDEHGNVVKRQPLKP